MENNRNPQNGSRKSNKYLLIFLFIILICIIPIFSSTIKNTINNNLHIGSRVTPSLTFEEYYGITYDDVLEKYELFADTLLVLLKPGDKINIIGEKGKLYLLVEECQSKQKMYYCFGTQDGSKLVATDFLDMIYYPMESNSIFTDETGNIIEISVERAINNEWKILFKYEIVKRTAQPAR